MITLIEGGFFAGGREQIKRRIKELCESKKNSILIVPEQDTVSSEDEFSEFLPKNAPLFTEVTNFTRFSDIVFRTHGGSADNSQDAAKRALIMWRTLTELSPSLKASSRSADVSYGTVSKMMATVKQMQSFAISASDLKCAESKTKDTPVDERLGAKLYDISQIMTLYGKLLEKHSDSAEDSLLLAVKKLSSAPKSYLAETEIFIDGFTSFTEPQYRMISALASRCPITVSLILPKASPDAYEYTETRDTHKKLVALASRIGTDVKLLKIDGRVGCSSLLVSEITDLLWKTGAKIDTDALSEKDSFRIFEAETPYEESDFVASDIKRKVMQGADYSDFAVIARNTEDYRGILDVSFKKAEIPLFLSQKTDISSYEAIKLIYSAISAVSSGFGRADVISYAKCSLSGLERELADEFELYVDKWQINSRRFTDGIVWNMNPTGYSDRRRKGDEEKLLRIDGARKTVISALGMLNDGFEEAKTVKDYAGALVNFLTFLDIEKKLREKTMEEKLLSAGASEIGQIWKIICNALDSLCDILGDLEVTPKTFYCLLKITFSETNIGKIPAFSEEVIASSANMARIRNKKHIYIIGANAGVFPSARDDEAYFTDKDIDALSSLGIKIDKNPDAQNAGELYYFTRALSFAKESVTILYSASDSSFKSMAPSDAVLRIKALTNDSVVPKKLSELSFSEKAYSAEYAMEHINAKSTASCGAKEALFELGYSDRLKVAEGNIKNASLILSDETVASLYGKTVPLTQSKLELYASCPMSYFCTYNLKLNDNEKAEFDARNIGNFLHSVLENFFRELKRKGKRISELTEEEKLSLIHGVADEYISKCFEGISKASARLKATVDKLSAYTKPIVDNLCDEFSNCKYEPVFFELEIDKDSPDRPSPVIFNTDSGKNIFITGKIDRVDTFATDDEIFVRVVDYKSGKKVFSPDDLDKGVNLQMFLYLKSIVDTDKVGFIKKIDKDVSKTLVPAGVLYVKTSVDDIKAKHNDKESISLASKEAKQRLGMVLDDEKSLGAMNSEYIPIKFKKDGQPDAYTKKYLYTKNGWDAINNSIEAAVKSIAEKMISGNIDALPLKKYGGKSSACEYCKFKSVCRNAN